MGIENKWHGEVKIREETETVDKKENTLSSLGREETKGSVCVCVCVCVGQWGRAGVPACLSQCLPSDSGSGDERTPLSHPLATRSPPLDTGRLNLEQAAVLGTCSDALSRWQQCLVPVSLPTATAQKMTAYTFFFIPWSFLGCS